MELLSLEGLLHSNQEPKDLGQARDFLVNKSLQANRLIAITSKKKHALKENLVNTDIKLKGQLLHLFGKGNYL